MIRRTGFILLTALFLTAVIAMAGSAVHVLVKKTSIRADKTFFSKTIATAKYKDKLKVLETKSGWLKVKFKGKKGWVHESAVGKGGAKKKDSGFSLFGKKDDPAKVSGDEVALAGKGFNEQVEKKYKKKNPKLNFAAVDKMEKVTIKERLLVSFIRNGKLEARELKEKSSKGFFGGGSDDTEKEEEEF